jgi:hypothetical protein
MESEEQCNAAGDTIYNSKDLEKPNNLHELYAMHAARYICIKGKQQAIRYYLVSY